MAWDERKLRAEIEQLFGSLVVDDRCPCNRGESFASHLVLDSFVSTESEMGDDAYGGHLLYAPPWTERTETGLVPVDGPQTLSAYAEAVVAYESRGFWREENSAPRDLVGAKAPKKSGKVALRAKEAQLLPLLSPAETTVYELRYHQGLTWKQIADRTGKTAHTARTQDRAIKRKAGKLHAV